MGSVYLNIFDDFDARKLYEGLRFYSRGSHNIEKVRVKKEKFRDNIHHEWAEETLEFLELGTEVKLTYYSFPCQHPEGQLAVHTLEIEISGENNIEDTIRKIGGETGIGVEKYIRTESPKTLASSPDFE